MPYADVNGLHLYYEEHGEGPALVLLHGGLMTIESNFAVALPVLAERHRVIALEFAPTQLRIATVIGADALIAIGPQQATIEGDRIAVTPLGTQTRQEISL